MLRLMGQALPMAAVDIKNVTRYNFDGVHANNDKKLKDKREVRGIRDE